MPNLTGAVLGGACAAVGSMAAPALRVYLRRRVRRDKEIAERLPERWGEDTTPRPAGKLLWLHAASVGETVSLLPVLSALPADGPSVLFTTGTKTSAELLVRRLPDLGLSERVIHRFLPLDVPAWGKRFLDHWRPDAVGFVESELWPNLLATCRARGIPAMLINARMSARSFASWRRVPGFAREVLGTFSTILARGPEDAARLRALGMMAEDGHGDLKFAAPELPCDATELGRLRERLFGGPVWVAASTHPGEEVEIARAHAIVAKQFPAVTTIVVPRHPERGAEIAAALHAPRRSAGKDPPDAGGIWIADTLGELGLWYRLASVAFVGRSLLPPGGGQNPLEPARLMCPAIVGPFTGNFAEPVAKLTDANALVVVHDAEDLAQAVVAMLSAPRARAERAARGHNAVKLYADLPTRVAESLIGLLGSA